MTVRLAGGLPHPPLFFDSISSITSCAACPRRVFSRSPFLSCESLLYNSTLTTPLADHRFRVFSTSSVSQGDARMSKEAPALDRCLNRAGKGPRNDLCGTHARVMETKGTLPHGTVPESNAAGAAVSSPNSESSSQEISFKTKPDFGTHELVLVASPVAVGGMQSLFPTS